MTGKSPILAQNHQKLQSKCFIWHWNTYPESRRLMWMNLNNAPNAKLGAQYKAMGMVAGVPDISFVGASGIFVGIEFKVGADKQSDSQIQAQNAILARGGEYHIVSTFEHFKEIVEKHEQ